MEDDQDDFDNAADNNNDEEELDIEHLTIYDVQYTVHTRCMCSEFRISY